MASTNNPMASRYKHSKTAIWGTVAAAVFVAGFLVYAFLNYGGVSGYWQAHQRFPGAHAPALQSGRTKAENDINSATAKLTRLKIAGTITALPIQRQDLCEKGEHTLAIAGATEDSWAYSCRLESTAIITYSAPECDVAQALLDNGIPFGSLTKDCPQEEKQQNRGGNFGVSDGNYAQVSLDSKGHYAQFFQPRISSGQTCSTPRVVVYCEKQNADGARIRNDLNALPADVQTIIEYDANATYYTK